MFRKEVVPLGDAELRPNGFRRRARLLCSTHGLPRRPGAAGQPRRGSPQGHRRDVPRAPREASQLSRSPPGRLEVVISPR